MSPDRSTVFSSMGWVDGDAIWRLDVASGSADTIPLASGARYVSLHAGDGDRFAVAHHFDGRRFEVSVRALADLSKTLARAVVGPEGMTREGDAAAWTGVPRVYVAHLAFEPWRDFVLIKTTPAVEIQELSWFDETYDKDWQGVISALELTDGKSALVSVQRSSRLIVHDLETGARRRTIDLGGGGGNPALHHRPHAKEIWATDYDAVAVVGTADWRVSRRARLQGAAAGTQQFIGDISFAPDNDVCVVARPFSGDVVAIDCRKLKRQSSAALGSQPLAVAALAGGEVVARDWKTGTLLRGQLRR